LTMNETTPESLTAAKCAARTGLTIRALRVYENHGLIKPGRSAAGWRRYGAAELLQLNQIALLKVLGLTLNQIANLMHRPSSPSLRQLLEMQLSAWRKRRSEAERGEAVTEAALGQLQSEHPLSVDELCSLIRSIESMTPTAEPETNMTEQPPPGAAMQDRYVGHYLRNRALGVTTIARNGDKLVLEPLGQPPIQMEQIGEADFVLPTLDLMLCFEQYEEGAAKKLTVWAMGVSFRLERTDAQTASAIRESIAHRVRAGVPVPGSAKALRRVLDGARTGAPDYVRMSPQFAELASKQLAAWQITGQYFGPIVSVEFVRVSPQGWDIYQVQHENDVHRYRIAIGDDGKVHGFSEASATAEKRAVF
jgi:DNA-binding transcriptional MerR regulator